MRYFSSLILISLTSYHSRKASRWRGRAVVVLVGMRRRHSHITSLARALLGPLPYTVRQSRSDYPHILWRGSVGPRLTGPSVVVLLYFGRKKRDGSRRTPVHATRWWTGFVSNLSFLSRNRYSGIRARKSDDIRDCVGRYVRLYVQICSIHTRASLAISAPRPSSSYLYRARVHMMGRSERQDPIHPSKRRG